MRARVWFAALTTPVLLSACEAAPPACENPSPSGVTFVFEHVLRQHEGEDLSVEACVEDTCETTQTGSNPTTPAVDVASPALTAEPVDVTLTITDATGKVLFDSRATVKPLKLQRDDPGCEGSTWHAMAVAKAHGKLRNEDFGKG